MRIGEIDTWYTMKQKAVGVIDISILDEIGHFGITAAEFIGELNGQPDAKVINLNIHSPGGSVPDGLAIYNSLLRHPATVNGTVLGMAGSAASFVLMASDHITMPEDSFLMIHNAWMMVMGDTDELRSAADGLEEVENSVINIYQKRTEVSRETLQEMMAKETWIGAEEAIELGFADTISDKIGIAAKIRGFEKYFKSLPVSGDNDILLIDKIETITDLGRFLRNAAGLSRKATDALVARAKVVVTGEPPAIEDETGRELLAALEGLTIPTSLE
jgi:ATP-dependent protease ClpP protease subunit